MPPPRERSPKRPPAPPQPRHKAPPPPTSNEPGPDATIPITVDDILEIRG